MVVFLPGVPSLGVSLTLAGRPPERRTTRELREARQEQPWAATRRHAMNELRETTTVKGHLECHPVPTALHVFGVGESSMNGWNDE